MVTIKRKTAYFIRQIARYMLEAAEEAPKRYHYIEKLQYNIHNEIGRLKAEIRALTPDNPVLAGYKVFSQVDEDGIIQCFDWQASARAIVAHRD